MGWIFAGIFFLLFCAAVYLLVRASKRLLEFDSLFQVTVGPMQEYADELRRIATSEGLLNDHPDVIKFHQANIRLMQMMDENIAAIKAGRPQKKEEKLPRPEAA